MYHKIALYQKQKGKHVRTFNKVDIAAATKTISLYPATSEGIELAVNDAVRADAMLVRITEPVYDGDDLLNIVEDIIEQGGGVDVFKPAKITARNI